MIPNNKILKDIATTSTVASLIVFACSFFYHICLIIDYKNNRHKVSSMSMASESLSDFAKGYLTYMRAWIGGANIQINTLSTYESNGFLVVEFHVQNEMPLTSPPFGVIKQGYKKIIWTVKLTEFQEPKRQIEIEVKSVYKHKDHILVNMNNKWHPINAQIVPNVYIDSATKNNVTFKIVTKNNEERKTVSVSKKEVIEI